MTGVVLVLLALVALAPSVTTLVPTSRVRGVLVRTGLVRAVPWSRWTGWLLPAGQVLVLAVAGLLAARAAPVTGGAAGLAQVLAVTSAAGGASPLVRAAFRVAQRSRSTPAPATELLHGGAVIGVLERAAVTVSLLAGFGEGLAVVLAVKGLARYPELREARAGEQFIIGTFTSVLWAAACWATVAALLT